jgi:demethylmenaquinone methyltransferase / 2-methoxy-6-polyprenyl-1,4-benzoquinol methylase
LSKLPSPDQKEKFVKQTFNQIAKNYDLINTLMSMGRDKRWRSFTVQRSEVKPGDSVLDVCCGTGYLSMELAKVVGNKGQVTGLDFSENMLAVAAKNVESFPLKNVVKFIQGNAMELPFEDNSFAGATVGWGLRNLPDLRRGIKEMTRVIEPGCKLVSLDMGKPSLPVFKQAYWLYFNKLVPLMGKIWSNNRGAYQYLHDSTQEFPAQAELARVFTECGLVETKYHSLMGGVVAVVEGRKPA